MVARFFLFVLIFSLAGCARGHQLQLHWQTTRYVNPGPEYQKLSVEVKLYQLSAMQPFLSLSERDLLANGNQQNSESNIISTHRLWMAPEAKGEESFIVNKKALFVAVAVNFYQPCNQSWRAWKAIPNHLAFQPLILNVKINHCHVLLHFKPALFQWGAKDE